LVLGDSARGGAFVDHNFVHPELGFAITFPKGWAAENAPTAVLAQAKDQSAVLALQVAAEGDDPAAFADQIATKVELSGRNSAEINGYPAATAAARVQDGRQEIYIALAWIAKDGLIYQVLGATTPTRWDEHRPTFEASARSFRQASEAELASVRENRLRLVEATPGQTLGAIAKRGGNQWSVAKTAAANAMESTTKLNGGESVKVSRREPYRD